MDLKEFIAAPLQEVSMEEYLAKLRAAFEEKFKDGKDGYAAKKEYEEEVKEQNELRNARIRALHNLDW